MGPACLITLSQQGQQPLLCTQAKPICRAGCMLRHGVCIFFLWEGHTQCLMWLAAAMASCLWSQFD